MLSTKVGKEAYIEPVITGGGYHFTVKVEKPKNASAARNGTKLGRGNFQCLMSNTPISGDYIKAEGKAGRMGARLMMIVAEGDRGRVYFAPTPDMEAVAQQARPTWKPNLQISGSTQYLGIKPYGMNEFSELFTDRQLVALTTFSDLAQETRQRVQLDALTAGSLDDDNSIVARETQAAAYADAIATYLALCVSKSSDYWSNICIWRSDPKNLGIGHVFSRQAIQMTWDYAEGNPFSGSSGSWMVTLDWIARVVALLGFQKFFGQASQEDAAKGRLSYGKVISTDPPYYDNVPYADLSDFFYVWLRHSLKSIFPELFATLAVPKIEELVAFAYRHNGKAGAEAFFLNGMTRAMSCLAEQAHPAFPVTIYYAFRQSETESGEGTSSAGWQTFLEAVIRAGFAISGTWPMRTELMNRTRSMDSNALASSIILVCRHRPAEQLQFPGVNLSAS
jgi:putative DNA methylase